MLLTPASFAFLSADAFTVVFNISNYDRSKKISFFLTAEEKEHLVETDQLGSGVFSLDNEPSQYVYMQYGEKKQVLFVESGKKLIVYWEDGELPLLRFEGDGAKINEYLNSRKLIGVRNRDTRGLCALTTCKRCAIETILCCASLPKHPK